MARKGLNQNEAANGVSERTLATRRALLLSAERLYARRGIDGVSLREINLGAAQKNLSAIHYHFGSREAVVEGIFQMRAERIGARRNDALAALRAGGAQITLRSVIEGIILPQAEVWREEGSDYHYNRFLAQAALSANDEWRQIWHKYFGKGLRQYGVLMQRCLPDMPVAVVRQRLAVGADFAIYAMANLERIMEAKNAAGKPFPFDQAIENLIDMLTGAIGSEPSRRTRRSRPASTPNPRSTSTRSKHEN